MPVTRNTFATLSLLAISALLASASASHADGQFGTFQNDYPQGGFHERGYYGGGNGYRNCSWKLRRQQGGGWDKYLSCN